MTETIALLQETQGNPWMLLYLSLWGLGYWLKKYTVARPQWAVPLVGIVLGVALIDASVGGAVIGGVMALAQMGAYDVIKPVLAGRS